MSAAAKQNVNATQAEPQWLAEVEQLHMRFQLLKSGLNAVTHVLSLGDGKSKAVLIGHGAEWAAALTQTSSVNIRNAAPQIAELLPVGSRLTAPVNLANKVSAVWAKLNNAPTELRSSDACFVMHRPLLPRPPRDLPLVLASDLGRERAAEEMAFCWLGVRHENVPVSEFAKELKFADAVLWRSQQGPTESFRVFTELQPQTATSPRQILLGVSCGKAEHAPFTFAHLAHQQGKVLALVDADSTAHMVMLQSTGFERKRSINLSTYQLG